MHEFTTMLATLLAKTGAGKKVTFGEKVFRTMADLHQLAEVIWCGNDVVDGHGVIKFDPRIWSAMIILPKLAAQFPNFSATPCPTKCGGMISQRRYCVRRLLRIWSPKGCRADA